jgi:predicted DNA-binding protein with PD1-like motif
LKLLFKIVKEHGREIRGDFVPVTKKKEQVEFDASLHTAVLTKGIEASLHLTPKDGPLMARLGNFLKAEKVVQGYVVSEKGALNNVKCAFFLTRHKPSPTFSKTFFRGENRIIRISGFFLVIPSLEEGKRVSNIVPHLHVVLKNIGTGKTFSGHLDDAESGDIEFKIIPLSGKTMRRETNPNTGGMYLKTDAEKDDFEPRIGDIILFALGPGEDFPNKLLEKMASHQVRKARYSFAIGTLWSVALRNSGGKKAIVPHDGLELSLTDGEASFEKGKYSHSTNVQLTDRFGIQYKGQLVSGEVKDILEGALEVVS